MSLPRHGSLRRVAVPAGQKNAFSSSGRFLRVIESPVPVEIRLDDQPGSDFGAGTGLQFPEGEGFQRVEITNSASFDIVVVLWLGFVDYVDNRQALIEPETEFASNAATQIAAGATLALPPALTGLRMRRKAVNVSNMDAALLLELLDPAGVRGMSIPGGYTVTLPVSREVRVRNPNGAPVAVAISEIYWTR